MSLWTLVAHLSMIEGFAPFLEREVAVSARFATASAASADRPGIWSGGPWAPIRGARPPNPVRGRQSRAGPSSGCASARLVAVLPEFVMAPRSAEGEVI